MAQSDAFYFVNFNTEKHMCDKKRDNVLGDVVLNYNICSEGNYKIIQIMLVT